MKTIPCIKYDYELNISDMETVKLEKVENNVTRKRNVPVFSAKYGVAGLFHVIDKFAKAADKLNFDADDKWNEFSMKFLTM
jgi:hypothetical protein